MSKEDNGHLALQIDRAKLSLEPISRTTIEI
jgi:hypothetical protein